MNYSTTSRREALRECRPFRCMLLAALAIPIPRALDAQAKAYETLYNFKGSPDDGGQPSGGVLIGKNGVLYGTTYAGGASGDGTIFALTPEKGQPWTETVLHNFSGSDGQYPASTLVAATTGTLYGTTEYGGSGGQGTIFQIVPPTAPGGAWTETVLYGFSLGGNPSNVLPNSRVLIGPGGVLYGTTEGVGGARGMAIELAPPAAPGGNWIEYELYSFKGAPDGGQPFAGVVSHGGSLFGTTIGGGDEGCGNFGCGTVYQLTPPTAPGSAWTETILHTLTGPPGDGAEPEAALTVGPGGVLYGTTNYGGSGVCTTSGGVSFGCGTVLQLMPPAAPGGTWTESVIYNFTGADGDGAYPDAGVIVGKNGALYGTTSSAGSASSACPPSFYNLGGCGIIFELTPPAAPGGAWTETVLHSFSGGTGDGAGPGPLALSSTGVLYGTTSAGGTAGKGTVFALVP